MRLEQQPAMGRWTGSTLIEPALEDEVPQGAGQYPDPGDEIGVERGVLGTKPSFPDRVQHGGWSGNVYGGTDKEQSHGPPTTPRGRCSRARPCRSEPPPDRPAGTAAGRRARV